MTRNIQFAPNEFYHIYNRGTEKRDIFSSSKDYNRFLTLLYVCNGSDPVDLKVLGATLNEVRDIKQNNKLVDICAYCLMPNHFHLIIKELVDDGISKYMQKLTTAYTMYFNKKNDRTGALFQGRFKATHIDDDNYLSYLIAYVHLNPVKILDSSWKEKGVKDASKVKRFLNNYNYSSFIDYSGNNRVENLILNMKALPEYFETPNDYKSSVSAWLNYNTPENLQGSTL